MTRQNFYLFFILFCLASCASQSTHWVSRNEVHASPYANIKLIELTDSSTIIFDQNLGWYDAKKQVIEGITITGWHDTTALAKVQRAEITEADSNDGSSVLKAIGIALLISLGLSIIAGILLLRQFSAQGGCLILAQIAIASAATMTTLLLIIFLYRRITSAPSAW